MSRDTCNHFVPIELACTRCNTNAAGTEADKNKMHGSSTEYIVQIRVQDYWIDLGDGLISREFRYREDAEKHLTESKKNKPNRDFQLVKRTYSFIDEVV